ncbi:MAG: response regulator [Anaerolineae bacterium]|jgi:CheY-like chemotaxis protein
MHPKQILIVDDEPVLARGLVEALTRSNGEYQVYVAHSGEEALELLHRSPQDLLVTDLHMPGIDGLELIRWVRAFYPHMTTILITATADDVVERQARSCGVSGFIAKPFELQRFLETVRDLLHAPGAEQVTAEQRKAYF